MSVEQVQRDYPPVVSGRSCDKVGSQSNSVRRALAILELLKQSGPRRSLSDISRKLALPKSTTSVLLSTLESMGYITRDSDERRYLLTSKAYGFGLDLLNQLDLSRRSEPVLTAIAGSLNVTAHVSVQDGDQALFVNKADGMGQPCCDIYPGRRTNLHCTAIGKILLANLSDEERRMFFARHRFIRHTSRTIVHPEALIEEIAGVRKLGYATDNQEEELQVRCLAVRICNGSEPVAALGITGTPSEIRPDPDQIQGLVAYLKKMSGQIFEK
jgi:DNA-binding IclR family transcriptional regulator